MQFGLFGSAQARRGGPSDDSGAGFREFVDRNVEAEALGYHSTFLVEHHFTGFGQVSATLNLLTWIGARTTTLRLGTAVLVLPWHNPVLLAEQIATLDLLSGGRVDAGVGKGYRINEFNGFCVSTEEADERFEECLEVMTKAWTSDMPWSHQGTYWKFNEVVVDHMPLLLGHETILDGQDMLDHSHDGGDVAPWLHLIVKRRYLRRLLGNHLHGVLRVDKFQQPFFPHGVEGHDLAAALYSGLERVEKARTVRARILPEEEDGIAQVEILELARPDWRTRHLLQPDRRRLVTHIRTVWQVVMPVQAGKERI